MDIFNDPRVEALIARHEPTESSSEEQDRETADLVACQFFDWGYTKEEVLAYMDQRESHRRRPH